MTSHLSAWLDIMNRSLIWTQNVLEYIQRKPVVVVAIAVVFYSFIDLLILAIYTVTIHVLCAGGFSRAALCS